MSLLAHLLELGHQSVELGAGFGNFALINQTGMASGLPQTQQRLERLELDSAPISIFEVLQQSRPVVGAQLVVLLFFAPLQITKNSLLGLIRKLARHLAFRAPKHKGPQCARQQTAGGGFGVAPGTAKYGGTAEETGVEKFEQTPELAQMVFHRGTAHRQAVVGA